MSPVSISSIKTGHIHDVQELRKSMPTKIPHRYIRNASERPNLVGESTPSLPTQVPIIDLSKLNTDQPQRELSKLAFACEEWGFFQVINHGIDIELLKNMEKVAMEFFMLPVEEKQKCPMEPGTVQGYGQAFVFSEDQKLDWCNMLALAVEPSFIRNTKLWPTNPTNFSDILENYSANIRKLCKNLLELIAMSLGMNRKVLNEMFGEAVQAMRMNYYPPCPRPDLVLGLSPHSDGSALTVLQQRTGSSVGLQILKNNTWIPVRPVPGALVINVGDTIEVLTNGKYKSVEHRAVTHMIKDRLSVVTFYAPSFDIELGPMKGFVDDERPCKYRKYLHGEYSKHYTTNKLQGKKSLDFARIQTKFQA